MIFFHLNYIYLWLPFIVKKKILHKNVPWWYLVYF